MTNARRASATFEKGFITLALLLVVKSANADSPEALNLFQEGRTLYQQGKYAEAAERFTRSQQLEPGVGTLLNLGDCYKQLGKTASALSAYREAEKLAQARGDQRRAEAAGREMQQLEPSLTRLRVEVSAAAPGQVVRANGNELDATTLATAFPVDPGQETLSASAPGRKPWSTNIEVAAGTTSTVKVPELEPLKARSGLLAASLEIGGGVFIGTGLVFGYMAMSKWSGVTDVCPNKVCKTTKDKKKEESAASSAKSLALFSTVFTAVGLVALGAGFYFDFFNKPSKKASVVIGPGSADFILRWQ